MKAKHRIVGLVMFMFLTFSFLNAQEYKLLLSESKLTVDGTSNLHDWTIEAKTMSGTAGFTVSGTDITALKNLTFVVEVEQLKSGKKGMDQNTFKALNSSKYKTINYKVTKVLKVAKNTNGTFLIETQGDLTINGVTKKITQNFTAKLIANKIQLTGKQTLNMTHYSVKPPTALLGTIKTGESVTINFSVVYQ
ncbi:YceI family protein [Flavobacterium sp. NRK F10]|uniref:YceI family protein n=1 Tax=Flavobacterium sediminis TaxID=2201181 RepID=A0A2U8QVE2_9FLAO|nr:MULTISPECIES: YceI family protein [Flavobacterium]AWM13856.1 YceI family protein [Flavobacterium sediminis]MCO6175033.1 YceI family protein [Flavobacterium sp. NRK F10]